MANFEDEHNWQFKQPRQRSPYEDQVLFYLTTMPLLTAAGKREPEFLTNETGRAKKKQGKRITKADSFSSPRNINRLLDPCQGERAGNRSRITRFRSF